MEYLPAPVPSSRPRVLNAGLRHFQGAYWTFLEAGTMLFPQQVEILLSALQSYPDHGVAYSDYEPLGTRQGISPGDLTADRLVTGGPLPGPSLLFRTELLTEIGNPPFEEEVPRGAERLFWLRLLFRTVLVHVREVLAIAPTAAYTPPLPPPSQGGAVELQGVQRFRRAERERGWRWPFPLRRMANGEWRNAAS